MKKLLKQLICVVLALCIVGSGAVCGFISSNAALVGGNAGSNVEWSLENGILEIIGNGSTGSYAAVSAQKAPWYNRRDEILHVKIGEGITTIGAGSLRNCGNVLDVSLPETLKEISETAFSGCNKLQQISIPAGVQKIDASAFLECAVLERITVDSANPYFTDVDGVLFSKDKTKLILFPKGKIVTEYTVPATVTQIGDYAFANCSELITVNIPSSVKAVGTSAFLNCRTLFTAEIPEGVTAIKPNTFSGCSALYEVKLPSTVTAIGSNAFGKCGSLMKINIPSAAVTIDNSAFSSSPNLTIYCNKGSFAHKYCVANSIDYCYSNLSSVYPVANWVYANVPHSGQRYARFDVSCSWEEAKLACEMLGGHLATVTSADEMATIRTLISGATPIAFWLGASDAKTEGTWEWITGEPFSYSFWSDGQPDNTQSAENYLEVWNFGGEGWNDNLLNGTNETRGFICEFENFYIPRKTTVYNGRVYCLYDELVSWYTAKSVCENMGGHLATITSAEEQSVVTELCSGSFYTAYWLGATDDSSEGTWKWVTGEPFSYTNWTSGEPNNANSKEHYLEQYYTWNDYIDNGYRGFICEMEAQSFSPVATGYHKGNRYEVYNNNLSWDNADQVAKSKGGHLATVTDSEESVYLQSLFGNLELADADNCLSIGGFRYKHETMYRWVTGERFVYSNWVSGEPNSNSGVENFIQVYKASNGWNDIGNKGSSYDGNVFIVEYESPKQVLTLSNPDGTVLNRYKVQGGMPVDAPLKDYKTGYTAEWYKEPSLQNKWNFETDVITADTVLYARWVPGVYKVSFDCGGLDSVNVTYGTAYGELPVPERAGYSFLGWFADEAYENPIDENSVVSITADHTLYAKWQAETYTVRFECNGGTADMPQKNVTFGTPYGELPSCVRAGSEFLGWYSDSDCIYPVGENDVVNVPNNHTLYAGWVESAVTGLKIVTKPNKTEYYVGDSLDAAGLVARATYANGSAGDITADRMTYSLTEFTTAGKKIVKAYYGEKYVSFIVNVKNRNLTSVSVEALPNKLVYTVGESLDTSGLILKAVYDDSSIKTVTDGFDVLCSLDSAGTKTVTVNYTENGVTKSASYQITVNAKTVQPDAIVAVDSASATAGEIISVPFRIENNAGFMGFAITVDYDAEAFTPVSVNAGELLSEGILENSIGSAYEYLKVVFVSSDNVKADGELFTVDFMVNENASGDYSFEVSYLQPDTFNEGFDNVVFKCSNFDISVSNAEVDSSTVISGGNVEVQAGEAVSVPLYIKNGVGLSSFSIELKYNGKKLAFSSASAGEVIGGKVNATVAETADKVVIEWNGSPVTKDGVLVYITFEAAEYVQSCENVFVLCQNAGFENGTAKNVVCTDALVNISNPLDNQSAEIYSKNYLRIVDSVIEIPVYIRNNHGMMGFGMTFEYDASVITPIEAVAGDMFSSGKGYFVDNIGTKDGSFKVLWNHTENVSDNGLLFTLRFSVAEGAKPMKVPLSISYSQPDTYNEKWEDVELNIGIDEIGISYIFTATFMHNGEVIGTDEFFPDDESLDYPVIEPKPHYEWVWDEHDMTSGDITVEGRYVPVEYTISYYCGNELVSTDKYTVETRKGDVVLPDVPEKTGYTGKWNDFELSLEDITVHCSYTPIVYVATFTEEGVVIGTDEFTVEDSSLDYPEIESKEHYVWAWDEHKIVAENITVNGRYVPAEYTVEFVSNGKVVKTQKYTVETFESITAPEFSLPYRNGYHSQWESWEGKTGNITVNEIYVATEYTISFFCEGKLISSQKFTVETSAESVELPQIPSKTGYSGKWNNFRIVAADITVECSYSPIVYTATFMCDGKIIGTDTFTVEDETLDYPQGNIKPHYNVVWSQQDIQACNLTVNGRFVPITYTIKFVSNGKTVKTQNYNIETVGSIVAPAITLPAKEHYSAEWESWEGKIGNITVNEVYVPVKYALSFYVRSELVSVCYYTIETDVKDIILPKAPEIKGYRVEWPEITISYKDESVYAICDPIYYTATFKANGKTVAIRSFTMDTEKLNEPAVPKKEGYIAEWESYTLVPQNIVIYARYYFPEVVAKAKVTLNAGETSRVLGFSNFEATRKVWSSSDPSVATVDSHGNITAVSKGKCTVMIVYYGKDSLGNDIKASTQVKIEVKNSVNTESFKEYFRNAFDNFFEVRIHDLLLNFKSFMIVLFRYAY